FAQISILCLIKTRSLLNLRSPPNHSISERSPLFQQTRSLPNIHSIKKRWLACAIARIALS
ncbi:MAG: hypothetical protein F6K30_26010, partial [Cyanothece sp. SIO2G6]|nr:hypothetical protein [Cyanothece sp. SIO2G6]